MSTSLDNSAYTSSPNWNPQKIRSLVGFNGSTQSGNLSVYVQKAIDIIFTDFKSQGDFCQAYDAAAIAIIPCKILSSIEYCCFSAISHNITRLWYSLNKVANNCIDWMSIIFPCCTILLIVNV